MNLLHTILYGLKQIHGERTSASIFHLLKGKRSSQTLQDGTVFQLSFLFGIDKKLNRHVYDEQVNKLLNLNWIVKIQKNTYVLSSLGEREIKEALIQTPFPSRLDGLQYKDVAEIVWKRLSLLIQTVSNLQAHTTFLPIQQDLETTSWVKSFLLSLPYSREKVRDMLYTECVQLFEELPDEEASNLVFRFTGANYIGYTNEQLAISLHQDSFHTHMMFLGTLHKMIWSLSKDDHYSLLRELIPKQDGLATVLSISTQKTYLLWMEGKKLEEIAIIRRLRRNTIEDHLVEIAMHVPTFPIEQFVSNDNVKRIRQIVLDVKTRKLRVLKQYVGNDIDYFSIRLVLASLGGSE
ncbi:helix-turn-helix domain-containing protein [Ectobacillus polymachus]|uniref:helix-turn-helix domain-containing protein n=1 Tax=Ectobacillus polymachus TaxID=1508806 RepID=UPI003A861693